MQIYSVHVLFGGVKISAMSKKTIQTGITGEFLAAAELTIRGYAAALTLKNSPNIDILVSDGFSVKAIQVKTVNGPKADWPCPLPKAVSKDLVYILVNLKPKDSDTPDFYIVPSAIVKKVVNKIDAEYAKKYFARHGKISEGKGVYHFKDEEGLYKNKWKNLGLKTIKPEKQTNKPKPAGKRKGE